MKQKVVIDVCTHDHKTRTKILKIAVSLPGVQSASLLQEKNQIEVIGDGVDSALLTMVLRRRLARRNCLGKKIAGYAKIYSVNPCDKNNAQGGGNKDGSGSSNACGGSVMPAMRGGQMFEPSVPVYTYVFNNDPYPPPPCSIL